MLHRSAGFVAVRDEKSVAFERRFDSVLRGLVPHFAVHVIRLSAEDPLLQQILVERISEGTQSGVAACAGLAVELTWAVPASARPFDRLNRCSRLVVKALFAGFHGQREVL